ncbi:hypothetical protein H1R20_g348, partial [Candolleomyces eurysporus]
MSNALADLAEGKIDFVGQNLVEQIAKTTLIAGAGVSFIAGFALQDLRVTFGLYGAIVVLLALLNEVPEDVEAGHTTPSHGGMIGGHEFDMPISQPTHTQPHPSSPLPAPVPRSTNYSHRPRPVSMPPQAYAVPIPGAGSAAGSVSGATATSSNDTRDRSTRGPVDENSHRRRHREDRGEHSSSSRSRSNRILGDYTLSKTLGAGSMGKVKLATHNITGEKLAVKILPRVYPNPPPPGATGPSAESAQRQASKDASKEIRTLREAALSMLLYHPYVCGMREMIVHQHHYYMVFEYVNGGQMLDYIISHGRLRERVARKFARQIGSALEYCHLNSVVHRDLKIENILISQTGNIKIIDFGLSNLYDPVAHLSTFCGSLYFAAPELLNAKVYTGPEVDVWSFGVVLYVLVCGKVPFDDQSMPALHAKIKRGLVEYPVWLSAECKHLLSRMLVTNPAARATLQEVMNHPWMTRGFSGPPDIHMVHREPLRVDELDRQVIRGMKGFEFGSEEEIERKLTEILESDMYLRAVQYWERKRGSRSTLNGTAYGGTQWGGSTLSNSSLAVSFDSNKSDSAAPKKSRRFSGFEYYRKKLFSPASSPPSSPLSRSPPNSQNSLSHPAFADPNREPLDPTKGFHPLISMYYLAREKMERERVYGPGQFASSQLSLQDQMSPTAAATVTPAHGDLASQQPAPPQQPHIAPVNGNKPSTKAKADYSMPLPRLPAPETSHYSGMSYDNHGVAPPTPTSPGFHNQPRARDPGLPVPPSPAATTFGTSASVGAGGGAATGPAAPRQHIEIEQPTLVPNKRNNGMPRAPPASTHRRSHSMSQRPSVLSRGWGLGGMFGSHSTEPVDEHGAIRVPEPPKTAGPEVSTFKEKEAEKEKEKEQYEKSYPHSEGEKTTGGPSPFSSGATLVRKFGSLLVGRGDETRKSSGTIKRGAVLGGAATSSPRPSEDVKSIDNEKSDGAGEEKEKENVKATKAISASVSQPAGNMHRRAATILDPQGRASRHERRSSTGAAIMGSSSSTGGSVSGGTIGRHRRPSTGFGNSSSKPLADRLFVKRDNETEMAEKREEEDAQAQDDQEHGELGHHTDTDEERDDGHATDKDFKPVFLKGLFSVQTTSTKPPNVIKADLRRVLDRMQIQYSETKAGFECIHLPSIDLASIDTSSPRSTGGHQQSPSSNSNDTGRTTPTYPRQTLAKKASKISFGMKREKGKEREPSIDKEGRDKESNGRPSLGTTVLGATSGSSSFFNIPSSTPTGTTGQDHQLQPNGISSATFTGPKEATSEDDKDMLGTSPPRSHSPTVSNRAKVLPPIPRDFAARSPSPLPSAHVEREVFESMGNNTLCVRFDINIVKVPWLPLHGLQFRRVGGDGWQYQMLARRVLTELKL